MPVLVFPHSADQQAGWRRRFGYLSVLPGAEVSAAARSSQTPTAHADTVRPGPENTVIPAPQAKPPQFYSRFIRALPIERVAITTLGEPLDIKTITASNDVAARLNEVQLDIGEGPPGIPTHRKPLHTGPGSRSGERLCRRRALLPVAASARRFRPVRPHRDVHQATGWSSPRRTLGPPKLCSCSVRTPTPSAPPCERPYTE
jgi:hypothetical protein